MKMDLNISRVDVLNSTDSLSSLNQSANILSVLMARQGWRDPGQAVNEAESKAQDKQGRLKEAFENHTLHPDASSGNQLLTLLYEAEADLKSEYDYAKKQQAIYETQAKQEAKSGNGFVSDWTQWFWHGVQDFFGSSSEALAEKYAQIATTRQRQLAELSEWTAALQQELLADSTPLPEEDHSESIEMTLSEIKATQRRLLQQSGSQVMVQNPPDQRISIGRSYSYSLNGVFSGNYTVLSATQTNQSSLPDWLSFQYQLTGSYPGSPDAWSVEVSGNMVLVADRVAGLLILDVTIPDMPKLLGNYSVYSGGGALHVVASGNRVFVATGPGLLILDISVPSMPRLLGNYTAPGTGLSLAVSGNTVFLADDGGGLLILDVSTPTMPRLLGNYSAGSGYVESVALWDNTLFVADQSAGLLILDVSIPATPQLLGNYTAGIAHADGVFVSGNTVYVADYEGGLLILDVSMPSKPRLLGSYPAGLGAAYRVEVLGNIAFVANRETGLLVLDVSTPSAPRLLGNYPAVPNSVYDVAVLDSTIFLANGAGGILVLDLTQGQLLGVLPDAIDGQLSITVSAHNETNILAIAQFTLQNSSPDQIIDVDQLYSYSLGKVFSGEYSILGATETNQLSLPDWLILQYQLLGTFYAGNSGILGPYRIKIEGQRALLAGSDSFLILDLSTPSIPKAEGNYTPNSGLDYGVALRNDMAFVTVDKGLLILNISVNPPQLVGNYTYNTGGLGYGVAVSGNTVFVSDGFGEVLILNISILNTPHLLRKFAASPGNVLGLTVSGNNLYICHDTAGLLIFDVSVPSMPQQIGNYTVPSGGTSVEIAVSGATVYLANGNGGLEILDMSMPSIPHLLSNYSGVNFNNVLILDNILYIASYKSGLLVFNVDNPRSPHLLGGYPIESNYAYEVAVLNNIAYIVTGEGGLLLVDLAQGQLTGIPPNSVGEQFSITVTAYNFTNPVATAQFTLILDNPPSHIEDTVSDQSLFPGNTLSLSFDSQSLFVNPTQSFLKLSLSMGTQELPSWLQLTLAPHLVATYPAGSGASVAVSGNTVFVVNENKDLLVIDVSTLSMPQLASQYALEFGTGDIGSQVMVSNNLLFLADIDALLIFNISTPNMPRLIGNYSSSARGLTISGNILYVADNNVSLLILNMSEPGRPQLLGKYIGESSGDAYNVAISGSTIYVADYYNGLLIIDVSIPNAPQLLGNYNPATAVIYDVKVSAFDNNILFVADGDVGLLILDVSTPGTPLLLSTYPAGSGYAINLAVRGNTVFVADYHGGVLILDTTIPSRPQLLGSYPSGSGDTNAITVSDNIIYLVANNEAGLLILEANLWQLTANPQTEDVGNYPIQLVGTDELGGSISLSFTIRVEGPPQIHGRIPLQYAQVGQTFNYFISQGLFTDPNFNPISFSAYQSNGQSLPGWLSFNSVSAALIGVPQINDQGTLNLTISANDHVSGITNTTFLLFVGNRIPQPPTLRQGRLFNFPIPLNTFNVGDGITWQYSANQSNGSRLPNWLSFNTSTLEFSGIPPLSVTGIVSVNVIAEDSYNSTIMAPLEFVVVVNSALQINPISDQSATVGDNFNFFVPTETFLNQNGYPLTYAALQTSGDVLLGWLIFNNDSSAPSFSGTPGRGDTNFYAVRELEIELNAFDGFINGSTVFRINVGGTSWGQLAIQILAPLVSAFTTLYTIYQLRALCLNRCFKERYQKVSKDYVSEEFMVGQHFHLNLKTPAENIERVEVKLPAKQASSQCFQFFQLPRSLPGGAMMPDWMKYDSYTNTLSTREPIPVSVAGKTLVVQISGKEGIILEQFGLFIQSDLEDKLIDVSSPTPIEGQTGVEMTTLLSLNQNSNTGTSSSQTTRNPSSLGVDSPLMRGERTLTSSSPLSQVTLN